MQAVDGLEPSSYLVNLAKRNIEGEITQKEVQTLLNDYYSKRDLSRIDKRRTREADFVSLRISEIIFTGIFRLSKETLYVIHQYLFNDIYSHAGKIRQYNISKAEWVLDGASVQSLDYKFIDSAIQYDLNLEKQCNYKNKTNEEIIEHWATFISNLWQIHPFEEGNTRTVAVFFLKYLRKLGFDVTNNMFAKHSWYFRNSLVIATYYDYDFFDKEIFLKKFLRNLILGEDNNLKNREMHISKLLYQDDKKVEIEEEVKI